MYTGNVLRKEKQSDQVTYTCTCVLGLDVTTETAVLLLSAWTIFLITAQRI